MKITTKNLCTIALGIALYVVLSATMKIPLIGHIQTDLGYIAFGVFCVMYGPAGVIVGAAGCVIESLIFSGWFPTGWVLGQVVIGIACGMVFKASKSWSNQRTAMVVNLLTVVLAVFVGVGIIKTVVECYLYSIPFGVKFAKNFIAFIVDTVPMAIGMLLGQRFDKKGMKK